MREAIGERLATTLLVLALACAVGGVWYVAAGLAEIRTTIKEIVTMADQPTTYTASWLGTDGLTHTCTTYKRAGETDGAFAQRHAAEVAALLAVFPAAS